MSRVSERVYMTLIPNDTYHLAVVPCCVRHHTSPAPLSDNRRTPPERLLVACNTYKL